MSYTNILMLSVMLAHRDAIVTPQVSVPPCGSFVYSNVQDALPPADSTILLTADVMKRMTTFWHRFQQEPDSIRTKGQNNHQEALALYMIRSATGDGSVKKRVVNMRVMTAQYPSVAKDLTLAGFTADTWSNARRSLYTAIVLGGMSFTKSSEADDTSDTGKDVRFVASHTKELDALRTAGMWIPDPTQVENEFRRMTSQAVNGHLQDVVLP